MSISVRVAGANDLAVQWPTLLYSGGKYDDARPSSYTVQYQPSSQLVRPRGVNVPAESGDNQSVVLRHLQPRPYRVRLRARWDDGACDAWTPWTTPVAPASATVRGARSCVGAAGRGRV